MRNPLGKGLSELLSEGASDDTVLQVPVENLSANRYQPRRTFDQAQLEELAQTIREAGILQPLVVRRLSHTKYEVIAGERRLRAAKIAGLDAVPAIVRATSDEEMLALALVENLQREDVNPADAAVAYKRLSDEFGLTQEQIAARVGKSRGQVSNALRLIGLPEEVFESLRHGDITEGHARALLALGDDARLRELHKQVVAEGLSVREAERRSRLMRGPSSPPRQASVSSRDPEWGRLEARLSEHLGALAQLHRVGGGGRISIPFFDQDHLEAILERMGIPADS